MGWTPSIVPASDDTVYLVVDQFFDMRPVWRETDVGETNFETVVKDVIDAQYNDLVRVVAFNIAENWAKDVTGDIANEVRRHFDRRDEDIPSHLVDFVEQHAGKSRQLSLRLASWVGRLDFTGQSNCHTAS